MSEILTKQYLEFLTFWSENQKLRNTNDQAKYLQNVRIAGDRPIYDEMWEKHLIKLIAAIHELSFQAAQENMPRRNTRAVWCQVNMTDRHFSSSAMIKMMGSSLKEL